MKSRVNYTRPGSAWAGLFIVCSALLAGPPTIETVAGSDLVGDGGPATAAFVSILEGVCTDSSENVYLADADNHRIRKIDRSGIITTYAGVGYPGFTGDGGPANLANLNAPYGITMDSGGTLYIADLGNSRIRKVSADGTISTVASNLSQPRNVALDAKGNLYVSEFSGHRVSRVAPDGSLTPVAGNGTPGFAGDGGSAVAAELQNPAGLAIDGSGTLYIADSANNRIRMVSGGKIETVLGGVDLTSTLNMPLLSPTGVALDRDANLYVAHGQYPDVFRWKQNNGITRLPGTGRDLTIAQNGELLIAGQQHLQRVELDGQVISLFSLSAFDFGDGGPAVKARFESVAGIDVDSAGNLTVADLEFRRIRQIGLDGTVLTLPASTYVTAPRSIASNYAGDLFIADGTTIKEASPNGPATTVASNLVAPGGLSVDPAGVVYFVDNQQVFSMTDLNPPVLVAGTGVAGFNGDGPVATSQQLNNPTAIAVNAGGEVLIADSGNHRIRKVARNGSISTVAGTGTAGSGGDGGPAASAQLNTPSGMVFDIGGNLWVADSGNNTIRTISRAGVIQLVAGTGVAGFSGDGGLAAYAQLSSPTTLAADASGNIYVADTGNLRVRRIDTGGALNLDLSHILTLTNAATFKPGLAVGGAIVSLFGQNLGPATAATTFLDTNGLIASQLGGTIVKFNGIPAPLFYVQAGQINAQVPVEIAGQPSALVQVFRNGVVEASATVDTGDADPGLFANNGNAAALNQDGSANTPSNPAPAGSVVVLYGTAFGGTDPPDKTGAPSGTPLGKVLAAVSVTVAGLNADVLYAGDAPGFVGLSQINAVIPAAAPSGQAEVVVTVGDSSSPHGVMIYVR